ncbi:MAG: hypothetical protein LUD51_05730 [Clostridia bacterium]|nr:hypothetical protein [Clostridia bacterium]
MADKEKLDEEPDYDYEGAEKLVTRLYGGGEEDYDPDIITRTIIQTLIDSGKKKLSSADFDKRVNYYWNLLRHEQDIYNQYMQLFKGRKDADKQSQRNVSNVLALGRMAIFSGLRYTSLMLRETGIFKGNFLRAYSEANKGKNWKAYVYTTPRHVSPRYKGECRRCAFATLNFSFGMHNISTVVINQETHNISFPFETIKDADSRLFHLDKKLQAVIQEGIAGEDLFPALMEQYYGKFAECTMKVSTVLSGWVEVYEVPDVSWPKGFVLRTETGVKLIYTDDLGTIKPVPAPKGSKIYKK